MPLNSTENTVLCDRKQVNDIEMMRRLNKILGYYIPTFFEMYVDIADDKMVIPEMADADVTVLFHEYIHFLQDFTTYYGANNLFVQSEYLHSVINRIKDKKRFVVPFNIEDNSDNVYLNSQICRLTNGDSEEVQCYVVKSIDTIEDNLTPNEYIAKIDSVVLNIVEDNTRSFGAMAIMESMAYIMERLCSPKSFVKSPDFPYRAAELVAQYYKADFGNNLENVLALCDMALQSSNPGFCFVTIMKNIQDGKLHFNTPEDIYDYFYTQNTYDVYGNKTSFEEKFNHLIETISYCLNDYIKDVPQLDSYHAWINHLVSFAKDWRLNDKYFLLKMARQTDLKKNNCWGYAAARVGSPLMENQKQYFSKLPYEGMVDGESVEMFCAIKEIYNLFFIGKKTCGMLNWCKDSPNSTPNDLCASAPWQKSKEEMLCPYAFFWKHWGLIDKEPL